MHFGDYIFIFVLALVLFGPKRLPEIGRQVGKLLAEFRRASNEFKFQIQEELRTMEEDERRKKLAEAQALKDASAAAMASAAPAPESAIVPASSLMASAEPGFLEPKIMPPASGLPVSADRPYAAPSPAPVQEPAEDVPATPSETMGEPPLASIPPVPHPEFDAPDLRAESEASAELESARKADLSAHSNGANPPAPETSEAAPTAHHA